MIRITVFTRNPKAAGLRCCVVFSVRVDLNKLYKTNCTFKNVDFLTLKAIEIKKVSTLTKRFALFSVRVIYIRLFLLFSFY